MTLASNMMLKMANLAQSGELMFISFFSHHGQRDTLLVFVVFLYNINQSSSVSSINLVTIISIAFFIFYFQECRFDSFYLQDMFIYSVIYLPK